MACAFSPGEPDDPADRQRGSLGLAAACTASADYRIGAGGLPDCTFAGNDSRLSATGGCLVARCGRKQQEAPLPPPVGPRIEPAIPVEPMPFPALDRGVPPVPGTTTVEAPVHAFDIRPWIVGVYLVGVAVGTGWWLVGIVGLARILWTSQPAPARCRELLAEISGGRGGRVRLLVSRRLSQPFASAWGRAVIVLPENLCGDERHDSPRLPGRGGRGEGARHDEQALRWCLAHEWAHVDQHDFRTWLLAGLVRVLFFYQPLLWWLRRQLRLCQDFVADAQAAIQARQVEDYAEFLTARAAAGRLHPAVVGLSMRCRKSELYRRVIMLLKNESSESRTPRLWTVSVTVAAMVLVTVVAAVSLVPRAVAEEKLQAAEQVKSPKKVDAFIEAKEPLKKLAVDLGAGVKMKMVLIPAGEFKMGSGESAEDTAAFFNKTYGEDLLRADFFKDEHPQHRVRITKPFYLGTYHVTRGQFRQFVADTATRRTRRRERSRGHGAGTLTRRSSASTRSTPGGTRVSSRPTSTRWST